MDPPELPARTVTAACIGNAYTPLKDDHDDHYGVPTLEELGEKRSIYFKEMLCFFFLINIFITHGAKYEVAHDRTWRLCVPRF